MKILERITVPYKSVMSSEEFHEFATTMGDVFQAIDEKAGIIQNLSDLTLSAYGRLDNPYVIRDRLSLHDLLNKVKAVRSKLNDNGSRITLRPDNTIDLVECLNINYFDAFTETFVCCNELLDLYNVAIDNTIEIFKKGVGVNENTDYTISEENDIIKINITSHNGNEFDVKVLSLIDFKIYFD